MAKTFKKIFSVALCFIMLIGTVAIGGSGIADLLETISVKASATTITSYSTGDTFEFGWYPQTKVEDEGLISSLNSLAGDNTTWTSYNYYSGTGSSSDGQMVASDYMRYKDVMCGTMKYRGVVFDSYRPYVTGYISSTDNTYQDDNGYSAGTKYWFKYEPIKWKVLDTSTGLVLTDAILDSQAYNNYILYSGSYCYGDADCTYYANNYAESSIRQWLNNDFYNTAFSTAQQNIIQSTVLDNSAFSTSYSAYDSVSTTDKIYLLSYSDVLNSSYGFITSNGNGSSSTRTAQGTDYAKCQGLGVCKVSGEYDGNSCWRLRSAGYGSYNTCRVDNDGFDNFYYYSYDTYHGVRAALNLNLASDIFQSDVSETGKSIGTDSGDVYNLGEETYSFVNYRDEDDPFGHCFGMSVTSSGYYLNILSKKQIIGCEQSNPTYNLLDTLKVRKPICYYQAIQGAGTEYNSIVAGGSIDLNDTEDIISDWNECVNYVKNHEYDNTGKLTVGMWFKDGGGHSVNFLYYKKVDGQDRIYIYDNEFPQIETYYYLASDGYVHQSPKSSGILIGMDFMDVETYFKYAESFNSNRYICANKNEIVVKNAESYPMKCGAEYSDYVMYKIPDDISEVTIIPLVNNATFTYCYKKYEFGKIDNDTFATLTVASDESKVDEETVFEIKNAPIIAEILNIQNITIDYKSSVTLHATSDVEGTSIAWFDANTGKKLSTGDTYTVEKVTSSFSVYAGAVDKSGNKIDGTESETETVTVKSGFFDKIKAFFRGLFGSLPKYVDNKKQ